jgi:hypothetical protein
MLEVSLPDRWDGRKTIGQVRKQAIDRAMRVLNSQLRKTDGHVRIVGDPVVHQVLVEDCHG